MKKAAVEAIAGARARGALRGRRARLWRRGDAVRQDLADPEPVRSAPDAAHRAGGRARRDGERRRAPPDRRFRRLRRSAQPLRVPLRLHHEAAVRQGARGAESACIYSEGEDERVLRATQVVLEERHREAGADRPARGDPRSHQALRARRSGRASISRSSIPTTIRATATMSRLISKSPGARA